MNCPAPEALADIRKAATSEALKPLAARAIVAAAGALTAGGQKAEAIAALDVARSLDQSAEMTKLVVAGLRAAGAGGDYAAMLGLLTQWWVVGPFELGEGNSGWDKAYINEPEVNLQGRYMVGKRRLDWVKATGSDDRGVIDLHKPLGPGDNRIAYAYTEITLPTNTDALLLVGADDSQRVWVNGQKVFEHFVARPLVPDQDRIPVKLKAGRNTILMKIWQNTQGWAFCARLTTPDGNPIEFKQAAQ
jgi:hypothetical protein